uniref:Reverse transcriptase domain-containing protein n=1 Tax=Tanacetum cinerariifolium TaxID=118510 RepID=A0A699JHP0_TANCI|nr:hypothetical protein [Tanacetum cinerariifolium]
MNHDEVNELRAKLLAKTHDPLALMAHSQNSYNFPATHNDQSSSSIHSQQSFLINNKYNPQPSLNQNFMQPPMTSLEDINDPTEAINAALILFAKALQLTAPTNKNQRTSSNPRNCVQNGGNQNRLVVVPGIANQNGAGNIVAARVEDSAAYCSKEEAVIQLQAEEFDFMAAAGDLDEIEKVNANCILMANLQHASTSAQYTDLLEPIPEPKLVPQNDNHVTSVALSMVESRGTLETSFAPNEETRAYQEIVYPNLIDQVAQVKRLQAQLKDLKGKSSDTPSALNTLDPLSQKLESKIVELEFQVVNYEREISHLKTTYKNLFDSITSNRAHAKLHNLIYENAKLRAWLFENTSESMNNTSGTSVTPQVDNTKLIFVTPYSKKFHASIPSHSIPQPREFNVAKHRNMIAPRMFKIDPSQTSRVDLVPNNQPSARIRTNPITNFQRHVTFKENVCSDTVNA